MPTGPALSVIIPAYNEATRLGATLEHVTRFLTGRGAELVVVDDGSHDTTASLAEAAGARVVRHEINRGKGAATRTGMLAARGERMLLCDADLATPIEELAGLAAALDAGADIAIGSRASARTTIPQPFSRRVLGRGFRTLVRYGLGITVGDPMCGFKLFTRAAAQDLFARSRVDGFAFDVEILYLARGTWRVVEVPVRWRHVGGSRVQLHRDVVRSALEILSIRRTAGHRR